jgi:CheY-like chemotaxis protein
MKYNYKILIIDDNIIDQIVTKQLLNKIETYAVSSAKDRLSGLKISLCAEDKLIILLDIKMPEMDGFAFLEELKN